MKFNCFVNKLSNLCPRFAYCDAPWQIGHICAKTRWTFFNHDQILHLSPHFFRPVCFRILFRVPGGTSTLSLPATVTVPDFDV